jgi:hypothetical protein
MEEQWEIVDSNKTYWSPKGVGEELVGEIEEITQGQYGTRFTIKTSEGSLTTPSHKVLQSRLQSCAVGDVVKIVYKGEIPPKVRGENPTKIYEVFRKKPDVVKTENIA